MMSRKEELLNMSSKAESSDTEGQVSSKTNSDSDDEDGSGDVFKNKLSITGKLESMSLNDDETDSSSSSSSFSKLVWSRNSRSSSKSSGNITCCYHNRESTSDGDDASSTTAECSTTLDQSFSWNQVRGAEGIGAGRDVVDGATSLHGCWEPHLNSVLGLDDNHVFPYPFVYPYVGYHQYEDCKAKAADWESFQTCMIPSEGSLVCIKALNETLRCPPKIKPFTPKTKGSFAFWTTPEFEYIKEIVRNFPSTYPEFVKIKLDFADNTDPEYCKRKYAELEAVYTEAMSNLEKEKKNNPWGPWGSVEAVDSCRDQPFHRVQKRKENPEAGIRDDLTADKLCHPQRPLRDNQYKEIPRLRQPSPLPISSPQPIQIQSCFYLPYQSQPMYIPSYRFPANSVQYYSSPCANSSPAFEFTPFSSAPVLPSSENSQQPTFYSGGLYDSSRTFPASSPSYPPYKPMYYRNSVSQPYGTQIHGNIIRPCQGSCSHNTATHSSLLTQQPVYLPADNSANCNRNKNENHQERRQTTTRRKTRPVWRPFEFDLSSTSSSSENLRQPYSKRFNKSFKKPCQSAHCLSESGRSVGESEGDIRSGSGILNSFSSSKNKEVENKKNRKKKRKKEKGVKDHNGDADGFQENVSGSQPADVPIDVDLGFYVKTLFILLVMFMINIYLDSPS